MSNFDDRDFDEDPLKGWKDGTGFDDDKWMHHKQGEKEQVEGTWKRHPAAQRFDSAVLDGFEWAHSSTLDAIRNMAEEFGVIPPGLVFFKSHPTNGSHIIKPGPWLVPGKDLNEQEVHDWLAKHLSGVTCISDGFNADGYWFMGEVVRWDSDKISDEKQVELVEKGLTGFSGVTDVPEGGWPGVIVVSVLRNPKFEDDILCTVTHADLFHVSKKIHVLGSWATHIFNNTDDYANKPEVRRFIISTW